jgi:hypothetical protein
MSLQIVQFTATSEHATDVETGIAKLFEAVEAAAPQQVQYLAARTAGNADFILLLHLAANRPNPLPEITEGAAFRTALPGWTKTAPIPQEMTVLGNYRMLNAEC